MSWLNGPFLGFDLETTGLDLQADRLVTAALVKWEAGQSVSEHKWLANPGIPISESATAVHGISNQYAQQHGQDLAQVVQAVHSELSQAVEDQIPLVIYNATFDFPMIENHFARLGLPRLKQKYPFVPVLDPLVIDRWQDRYRRGKRKLVDVANHYMVLITESLHDSLADVRVTMQVLDAILETYPELGDYSLPQIYQAQQLAHQEWAQGLNRWMASKGINKPPISEKWLS